ncbi:hypothetical protein E3O53_12105 [Cryobacterium sp. TMT2-18-3]|uniref:sensor histidine kinase n=1 Tax=unclassified Cryobacterium TaxID=2649013 RepID=UPI00106903DE|nr:MULTISPECIES: hypothetical protein [unclassified Cryobacterium]TFC32024.1 hypothetical protein E3O22_01045 [Cryobacterium sp. TMT2-18-2]TFC62936.1 hypothetical protein E3O53_12105 [Cryobacterium sp. TMT2-18-3]
MSKARQPPRPQGSTERLARLLYAALGPTALVFGLLCLGAVLEQAWQPRPAWSMAMWQLIFGLPVLLALLSVRAPLRVLRPIALAEGALFVLLLVFWLTVRAEPLPAGADIPWAITLTGVPVMAVAVATRDRTAWAYLVLVCTMSGLLRAATSTDPYPVLVGVEDGLYSFLLLSMLVGLTTMTRRSAGKVDQAATIARVQLVGRADRLARKRERLTIDALVHDSVISTLLMAGRGGTPVPVLSRHAADTLVRLDALRAPLPDPSMPGPQVTRRLEQLAAELAPDAQITSNLPGTLTVPALAVTALLGAVGEALRNSVAADVQEPVWSPVARTLTVASYQGGIRVAVHDNGVGFDPARVPAERLGIAQSIIGRMERLSGGAAAVRSRPGAGTEVVVSWTPNPEPAAPAAPPAPATPPPPPDPQSKGVTRLPKSLSRSILVGFIVVHAVLAFADGEPLWGLPYEILGFLALSAAAAWLTLVVPDPVSPRNAVVALALCGLAGAATAFPVPPVGSTPFAHWYLGAITMVLVVLAVRGRPGFAWYGYGMIMAISIVWALLNGLTLLDGVNLAIRHAGTLLAGTLFAVGLKRSTQTLAGLNRERARSGAAAATAAAALEERETQLTRVNTLARPTLQRLANLLQGAALQSNPLQIEPTLRAESLLVEATLRDAIRGRSLFVEPVISAARAARIRGVDVTLLDDSADRPPLQLAAAAAIVAAQLDSLTHGHLIARLLPADRPTIASIVVDAGEPRMLTVTPDGLLQPSL